MTNPSNNQKIPKGHTAFLLIHGIGEQNPFETLDYFAQNLYKYFKDNLPCEEEHKLPFKLEHKIVKRELSTGSVWTESFVRLSSTKAPDWVIDIHEYYWAPDTEKKISIPEILHWTEQTLDGTIKFYNNNKDLLEKLLDKQNEKRFFTYRLRSLTIFLRLFNFVYPGLRLILWLILWLTGPFLKGRFLQSAWKLSKQIVTPPLVDFVGDIAIYSITDLKSPYQKIRQQILTESLTLLKAIIKDENANYDQVILAGHSLGSCIAYDTLNLLCIEASLSKEKAKSLSLDKIKGLITFGSPLDKIAFFFRERGQQGQYIRQRILEHLNSFRVKPEFALPNEYLIETPVVYQLEQVRWINYYHLKDPISGHLDYYENLENVEIKYPTSWGGEAHQSYWIDSNFYKDIVDEFLDIANLKTNKTKS